LREDNLDAIIISETHWDRAWYHTFEEFRLNLVDLVDKLLNILDTDPNFEHFTFDGQTVVLEDYLAVRPDQESRLRSFIQNDRISIGPWYILPDEYLVSGEVLIRNLLTGKRIANEYGTPMDVGYTPDPFGHVSQLPQILAGFGYDSAIFARGAGDEVDDLGSEFIWNAPEGTSVHTHWLPLSYGNIANLPEDIDDAVSMITEVIHELKDWSNIDTVLLMNGSDHLEPQAHLPEVVARYNESHEGKVKIGTLPEFMALVKKHADEFQSVSGEFRQSKYQNLLSGVYSTRIYLKQENERLQRKMERLVEPMASLAYLLGKKYPVEKIQLAWKYLLKCHPHDDICGCSIDEVHEDMMQRFRWTDEIADSLIADSWERIKEWHADSSHSLVLFNPVPYARREVVTCSIPLSNLRFAELGDIQLYDPGLQPESSLEAAKNEVHIAFVRQQGFDMNPTSTREISLNEDTVTEFEFDFSNLIAFFPGMEHIVGEIPTIYRIRVNSENEIIEVWGRKPTAESLMEGGIKLSDEKGNSIPLQSLGTHLEPNTDSTLVQDEHEVIRIAALIDTGGLSTCSLKLGLEEEDVSYKIEGEVQAGENWLENNLVRIVVAENGTISLLDKRTKEVYDGLLEFEDSEDIGDEYDYCPASNHKTVHSRNTLRSVEVIHEGPILGQLRMTGEFSLPSSADQKRRGRVESTVVCPYTIELTMKADSPRIETRILFENNAEDHRLRILFPTGTEAETCHADSAFDVIKRPIHHEAHEDWYQPMPATYPLRSFVSMNSGKRGLTVATKGLLEFEIMKEQGGTVALTLLRCVGWLSRIGMKTRSDTAGPVMRTPGAQCPGLHEFEFSIIPHEGDWLEANVQTEVENYLLPVLAEYGAPIDTAQNEERNNFVKVHPEPVKISGIKKAEDDDGLIVRVWNCGSEKHSSTLEFGFPIIEATTVNLAEEMNGGRIEVENGTVVHFDIPAKRIRTFLVRFDDGSF